MDSSQRAVNEAAGVQIFSASITLAPTQSGSLLCKFPASEAAPDSAPCPVLLATT